MTQQIPDEIVMSLAALLFVVKDYLRDKSIVSDGALIDIASVTAYIADLTENDPEELADRMASMLIEAFRHAELLQTAGASEEVMQ